jgi:hypothetical protein
MGFGARSVLEVDPQPRFSFELRPGAALRGKVGLAARLVLARSPGFESRPDIDVWLPELLFRTHCFARASAPLLRAALARVEELGPADRVAAGIRDYLREQIEEGAKYEAGLLVDLEVLGRKRAAVLARVPPTTIATGVGAQYYWISHYHPVAVMAYIAMLEHTVLPLELLGPLVLSSKLPSGAFRSLLERANRNPPHEQKVYAVLDGLQLTTGQKELLGINTFETAAVLERSLQEVFAHSPPARLARPAKREHSGVVAVETPARTRLDVRRPRLPQVTPFKL